MSDNELRGMAIIGVHRSGTTFLGEIIRRYENTAIIHEPFNKYYGLAGIKWTYPSDDDDCNIDHHRALLMSILNGKPKFTRHVSADSKSKSIGRFVLGGRTGLDYLKYRLNRFFFGELYPVFKDPFLSMFAKTLLDQDFGVVCVVRHPAAVWQSIKRMSWKMNFDTFIGRKFSHSMTGNSYSEVEKFAILWNAVYEYVDGLKERSGFFLIRHEDLCVNPESVLNKIAISFSLTSTFDLKKYIDSVMRSSVITPDNKSIHNLKRNSSDLVDSWRKSISVTDEDIIKSTTMDTFRKYYERW